MTEITAEQVRRLRERTEGAPMMDCKRALVAANGDIDAAHEAMRKAGQAKAEKKASRVAAEGIIVQQRREEDGKEAAMLEINCETDFVARDANFQAFATAVVAKALEAKPQELTALMELALSEQESVEQARQALVAKVGENIQVRRLAMLEGESNDLIGCYVHGGRIGVLVQLKGGDERLAKDLAMHIAANQPLVVRATEVPAELVAKEREIFTAQAQASGKPAAIIEKMVEGRVSKFLDEVSLLGQPFVKNPDLTVARLLAQANADVVKFVRFVLGEGIEKETENFVDAVRAQVEAASGG